MKSENKNSKRDMAKGDYIRFDWAMKRLLRNKADYTVVEGFLSVLIGESLRINKILESESNRDAADDKSNRVDLLMETQKGELLIIEIQNAPVKHYFKRMLFGTSKLVLEYIKSGEEYDKIRKIYSISIVYCSLGYGNDTVYHGTTEFRGIHTGELLTTKSNSVAKPEIISIGRIYPEYYLLKVDNFNDVAKDPLEEWIYYLKNGDIPEMFTAPGLKEARERLLVDRMSPEEYKAYDRHLMNQTTDRDELETAHEEGKAEGRSEIVRNMKAMHLPVDMIMKATGLSQSDIEQL